MFFVVVFLVCFCFFVCSLVSGFLYQLVGFCLLDCFCLCLSAYLCVCRNTNVLPVPEILLWHVLISASLCLLVYFACCCASASGRCFQSSVCTRFVIYRPIHRRPQNELTVKTKILTIRNKAVLLWLHKPHSVDWFVCLFVWWIVCLSVWLVCLLVGFWMKMRFIF